MKGLISERTGLVDFVWKVVSQRHFGEEEIVAAISLAEKEMIDNGIIAVGDICNNDLTVKQKAGNHLHYFNFIEASGLNPQLADQRFERAVTFYRQYAGLYSDPSQHNSIVPHAPYSVSDELWKKIAGFPGNQVMTIHNQESTAENRWFRNKEGDFIQLYEKMGIDSSLFSPSGKSSLQSYLLKFLKNQSLLLVHNVHTSEEDLLFAQSLPNRIAWCFCPNANLYIEGQLPALDIFIKHNCEIVLGTDSLASNHQLSILEEIKTLRRHFPDLATDQLLGWATINGAKALQMDKLLGSFETGKRPGIVLCENDLSGLKRLL